MKFRLSTLTTLIALVAYTAFSQSADDKYFALTKVLSDYDTTWNKKDVQGVSRILAPDYIYFSSTGDLTDRKRTLSFSALTITS